MHKLSKIHTQAPKHLSKEKTKVQTEKLLECIADRQKILFAQKKFSLLIILQGLDASGKDGLIAHVFQGLNPLGVNVQGFKKPTEEEAAHDFLWRSHLHTPERGRIAIFNRSYYEELLVPRVENHLDEKTLDRRIRDINNFEKLLKHNDTIVLKFYLHVSREEQLKRLKERKTNPEKFWKHNDADWDTRKKWEKYQEAYEDVFKYCNEPEWHIIPADQNWYKEHLVSKIVCKALDELPLKYPDHINHG